VHVFSAAIQKDIMIRPHFVFVFCIVLFQTAFAVVPVDLRCGFRVNPIGMDVQNPDLSWSIQAASDARAVKQTAYQVLVASSSELLSRDKGDLWNSGKVCSDGMGQIRYTGKELTSTKACFWKVRIWDERDKPSTWSSEAFWISGILNEKDWQAKWISAVGAEKFAHQYQSARSDFNLRRDLAEMRTNAVAPSDPNYSSMLLRKDFSVEKKLRRAILHVCGLGHYELTMNGQKVGDQMLAPGWSDYRKTVLYDSYDVTNQLVEGSNVVGLFLSNGMYNIQADSIRYVKFLNSNGQLKAKAQLQLEYSDGSVKQVVTDSSWQVSPGPVTYMNEYGGEDFDARLYPEGWDQSRYSPDGRWSLAVVLPETGAVLKGLSCAASPIKVVESLSPVKITKLSSRVWVYDLGLNAPVMPAIRVCGTMGSAVRIIPAELLKSDGTVDRASATQDGIRPAWWQYTLASSSTVDWFPKFFYQGCRYLQVEVSPALGDTVLPIVVSLTGKVVHSSATPIGSFQCSNDLFNQIYTLVRWAQRSNMMSLLTDCPAREKLGWLEQYHLNGPSLRYNFDLLNLFGKSMNDMADGQLEDGFVPNIAPEYFHAGVEIRNNGFRNSPEWGSSFIIVPWQQYLFSGDVSLIRMYYDRMKRYLGFLDGMAQEHILNVGLGDWYDIGPKPAWGSQLTPVAFTATAIYFYDYQVMAQMADLLGKKDESNTFTATAEAIRKAFNTKFYHLETGIYSTGSNTTQAMPLFFGLAEPSYRKRLTDTLVADIRGRGNAFNSGEVGYRFLLKALAIEGHSDLIFDMNNQTEKPGYGYQIKHGATSLTEKWDASVGSFGSQNHFMSGQINEWFFNDLLGIGVDPAGAGFRKFSIHPIVVGDLTWVNGSYHSVSGLISVAWKRSDGTFTLDVSVPPNTSATVYIPAKTIEEVFEGLSLAERAKGIKFLRMESGCAIFEVLSGSYTFHSKI
jgi:alpha-L-rhamnosidase